MCGIFFAFDPNGVDSGSFHNAVRKLYHRGPDKQQTIKRGNGTVFLGHTRLRIVENTSSGDQPLISPCGRWALIFNGEIYNYQELRDEIGDYWVWRTKTDTEVLLAAWKKWGRSCLQKLDGMFSFVIHDAKERSVTIVRDRFGIKPLYYLATGTAVLGSSEIQPLLPFLDQVKPNLAVIRTYLEKGQYDHSSQTFFAEITSLEPGSLIEYSIETRKSDGMKWYDLPSHVNDLSDISEKEILEVGEQYIKRAIHKHLVCDVNIGLRVSGGVDSGMLISLCQNELGPMPLYHQDYIGYSELPWLKQLILDNAYLNVTTIDVDMVLENITKTFQVQAEPFGGLTTIGSGLLYDAAKADNVRVLLDGNGVDEILLGYERYHQVYVNESSTKFEKTQREDDYKKVWGKLPERYQTGSSMDGTFGLRLNCLHREIRNVENVPRASDQVFVEQVKQLGYEDLTYDKVPRTLRFSDRMSMASSVELRVPFLDHHLVEFFFGIPTKFLITRLGGKTIFRKILSKFVPNDVAFARKRTIQTPQREWLGNDLSPFVTKILSSESFASRKWLNRDQCLIEYEKYKNGRMSNSLFLWQWISLELWARQYLD